jgi:hypothetical protein
MMGLGNVTIIGKEGTTEIVRSFTMDEIRLIRNSQLISSDWAMAMQDRWTHEQLNSIIEYRKELRDLPADFPDPDDARDNWPVEPDCIIYGVDS